MRKQPKRNISKLRWKIATTPSAAPAAPTIADSMKPMRRPIRRIISEIGKVVRAVPTIAIDMGSVAQDGLGASCAPTRPAVTTSAVNVAPYRA